MKLYRIRNTILAFTLILSVLLSSLVFSVSATETVEVWDGTTAETFAGGDGSANSPYLIETAEQLRHMVVNYSTRDASLGKYFKITKDIYLNDVQDGTAVKNLAEKNDWLEGYGTEALPAPTADISFCGNIDGDGHTIYGLYVADAYSAGLFPAVSSGVDITDLTLDNVYIAGNNGEGYGGAFAGQLIYKTWSYKNYFSYCAVTNAVIGSRQFVGGIVADTQSCNVTFTNCYSYNNNFTSATAPGGIYGRAWSDGSPKMNNCYSIGYFPVRADNNKTACTSVYTNTAIPEGNTTEGITVLTTEQMMGEAAKTNMSGLDFKYVWKTVENGYPVFGDVEIWDGSKTLTNHSTFKGSGTADDPYLIENGEQLYFAAIGNPNLTDGSCYKLTKDIILNNTSIEGWEATANAWGMNKAKRFNGTLDGAGYTIEGLYINVASTDGRYGLFSYVGQDTSVSTKVAEFKNITFVGASVTNTTTATFEGVGIVAGQASGETLFENIYIDETSKVNAPNVKGVAGLIARSNQKVTINNCAVHGTYTGKSHVGSFMGTFWGGSQYINNSYSAANVPVTTSRTPTISNVYATVKTSDNYYDKAVVLLTEDQMKGENAKTYMPGLSFKYIWETVENGYPVLNVRGEIWDGNKSLTDFSTFKGSGTAADPYLIENGAQLYYAAIGNANLTDGSCYKLVNDIVLNDTSVEGWEASAITWGMNDKKRFNGTLDGDGHTIEGLYINVASTAGRYGLFSYVGQDTSVSTKVAEFKNITFVGASVTNTTTATFEGVGIVAGQASGETLFENIYIDETSKVNAPNVKGVAGIIARSNQKVTINNCAVHGTYTGGSHVGSFMGTFWGGTQYINNSYSAANVPVTTSRTPVITNVYATVKTEDDYYDKEVVLLTVDQMKGENAKANMAGFDFDFLWKTVENGYPVLRDMADRLVAWDGSIATELKGEGTKANPYKISNGAELYYAIVTYSNNSINEVPATRPYFEITTDINLANNQWYVPGLTNWLDATAYDNIAFSGVIYGNGHTIYYFNSNAASTTAGLIPVATQGTEIYDLHLDGGTLPRYNWRSYALGGFIGLAKGVSGATPIIIDGCSVNNYTIAAVHGGGGFIGYSFSQPYTINDCYAVNSSFVADADKITAGTAKASAFVGYLNGSSYNNNFVVQNSFTDVAEIVSGQIDDTFTASVTYKNVYTTNDSYVDSVNGITKLTADQATGTTAKAYMNGFNFNQKWTTVEGSTPVQTTLEHRAKYFSGNAAESFASGTGTEADPYMIETADELYLLALLDRHETYGKFYKLANDITISGVYNGWANDDPYTWAVKKAYLDGFGYASSFAGTLDGAGFTVSGLYYNNAVVGDGTFAYGLMPFVTADAVIKNITVSDVNATVLGSAYVGAVAGAAHVMEEDFETSPAYAVSFVGVKVANVNITANTKGDLLGAASRGVKFDLCNTPSENLVGSVTGEYLARNCNNGSSYRKGVVIYTTNNIDDADLTDIRTMLLGANKSTYVVSLDMGADFNICDLVAAGLAANADANKEKLVWSDEFNGGALDTSVWTQSSTAMSTAKTLEYANTATFDSDAISLNCYDTGRTTELGSPIYQVNYGLTTQNSMSYKYGRLEMRAKIPVGAGAFPALWLSSRNVMGYDKYSEYSTEIDIFEVFGETANANLATTCIHKWYNDIDGVKIDECSCGTGNNAGNAYKVETSDRSKAIEYAWYTVEFEWTEDTMSFWLYKDGEVRPEKPYYTATRSDMDNAQAFDFSQLKTVYGFDKAGYETSNEGIFNQYMSVILTNHMYTMGKDYMDGETSKNEAAHEYGGKQSEIDANLDNLSFEIDYIRIYQDASGSINLK